jgi:hypothetical protein
MVCGYFAVTTSLLQWIQPPPLGIFGLNTLGAKINRFAAALEQWRDIANALIDAEATAD